MVVIVAIHLFASLVLAFAWIWTELRTGPRVELLSSFITVFLAWPLLLIGGLAIARWIDPHKPEAGASSNPPARPYAARPAWWQTPAAHEPQAPSDDDL